MGFEPTLSVWRIDVLTVEHYTRIFCNRAKGLTPLGIAATRQPDNLIASLVFPIYLASSTIFFISHTSCFQSIGIEPITSAFNGSVRTYYTRLKNRPYSIWLYTHYSITINKICIFPSYSLTLIDDRPCSRFSLEVSLFYHTFSHLSRGFSKIFLFFQVAGYRTFSVALPTSSVALNCE